VVQSGAARTQQVSSEDAPSMDLRYETSCRKEAGEVRSNESKSKRGGGKNWVNIEGRTWVLLPFAPAKVRGVGGRRGDSLPPHSYSARRVGDCGVCSHSPYTRASFRVCVYMHAVVVMTVLLSLQLRCRHYLIPPNACSTNAHPFIVSHLVHIDVTKAAWCRRECSYSHSHAYA
jgi:hypothetical protein